MVSCWAYPLVLWSTITIEMPTLSIDLLFLICFFHLLLQAATVMRYLLTRVATVACAAPPA